MDLEYLAGRLRDHRRRLTELSTSDRGVAAAFTLSYQHLNLGRQRMFRLLGLLPGRDIDAHAAAALADVSLDEAEVILEDLLDAHVLAQHEPGRYTLHDLLREHARSTASAEEAADARHDALTRLFDHSLYAASTAIDLVYPHGIHQRPRIPEPNTWRAPFSTAAQAAAWLDAERANLIAVGTYAADRDWSIHTSQLAATLRTYLDGHAHHTDALTLQTKALHASRRRDDRAGEGRALTDLGWVYWRQARYEEAHQHSRHALDVCREIGDRYGETRAHNTLANVSSRQRDYDQAHQHYRQALDLCREIGNRVGEAHVLGNLGINDDRQGRYEQGPRTPSPSPGPASRARQPRRRGPRPGPPRVGVPTAGRP